MSQERILETLLEQARAWHAGLEAARDFVPWPKDLRYEARAAHPLPHIAVLKDNPGTASQYSRALRDALVQAADHVEWRHTYSEEEVGRHFLNHFGWFELAGPEGHFLTDDVRITVGYWGPGLHYGRHNHEPEELYTVVSGQAVFHLDGAEDERLGPGCTRFHPSNHPHALTTEDHAILTLVFWRGDGLADPPRMTA